jgi:hypothetical protein
MKLCIKAGLINMKLTKDDISVSIVSMQSYV